MVGQLSGRIRQAGTALVQPDQPTALLKRPHEPAVCGLLPLQVQMRDQAVHHHQVRRPGARHLEGDLGPTRLRVTRLRGTVSHGPIIHPAIPGPPPCPPEPGAPILTAASPCPPTSQCKAGRQASPARLIGVPEATRQGRPAGGYRALWQPLYQVGSMRQAAAMHPGPRPRSSAVRTPARTNVKPPATAMKCTAQPRKASRGPQPRPELV